MGKNEQKIRKQKANMKLKKKKKPKVGSLKGPIKLINPQRD